MMRCDIMRRCTVVLLTLLSAFGGCAGLLCRVCSYSSDDPHASTDCIYSPALITGPNSQIHCNRSCFTQENFNLESLQIVSYMRTCSAKPDTGYCVDDTWSKVCYDSCRTDFCNDFSKPLHEVYPTQNKENPDVNYYPSGNAASHLRCIQSFCGSCLIAVGAFLLITRYAVE
ncbi:hypothetical protein BaRGS_00026271 [Batillaria attramentaria]|uniref:Uncharacterized protein n=1 Tax=Batillaria attramentaria TaxID=370345 RepID=A0ABD0K5C6_9CAEN